MPECVPTDGRADQRMPEPECGGGRRRAGEDGMALLMVLGVVSAIGLMIAHLTIITEVTAIESKVAADRGQLRYAAESAAERAYWLLLADRALNANRNLARSLDEADETQREAWMLDGREHEMTVMGLRVSVSRLDADTGIDCSGSNAVQNLQRVLYSDDPEQDRELIDAFLDVARDYVDGRNGTSRNGMEQADYEAEGLPDMPRDGPLEFAEEIYWLPGFAEAMFAETEAGAVVQRRRQRLFRIVPPKGMSFSARTSRRGRTTRSKPSFVSSTPEMIRRLARLTPAELSEVLASRAHWLSDRTPLEETLAGDLLVRVMGAFSFQESGVATFVATASAPGGQAKRVLRVTRDCRPTGAYADNGRQRLAYWEKLVY